MTHERRVPLINPTPGWLHLEADWIFGDSAVDLVCPRRQDQASSGRVSFVRLWLLSTKRFPVRDPKREGEIQAIQLAKRKPKLARSLYVASGVAFSLSSGPGSSIERVREQPGTTASRVHQPLFGRISVTLRSPCQQIRSLNEFPGRFSPPAPTVTPSGWLVNMLAS
jgi:hypothetical protein